MEPWIAPEDFRPGRVDLDTWESDGLKIARAAHSAVRGESSVVEFRWLVAREGEGVSHFAQVHEYWLCPRDVMHRVFEEAGFATRFEPDGLMEGRGLFLGRRRP